MPRVRPGEWSFGYLVVAYDAHGGFRHRFAPSHCLTRRRRLVKDSDRGLLLVANSSSTHHPRGPWKPKRHEGTKKGRGWSPALLYSLVLNVALTIHRSLPSCLRCSDNTIVSPISFRGLNSLHPGYRAAVAGQRCLYSRV